MPGVVKEPGRTVAIQVEIQQPPDSTNCYGVQDLVGGLPDVSVMLANPSANWWFDGGSGQSCAECFGLKASPTGW
jgi:hypothetical protein